MSQVIVEIGTVPVTGRASLFPATGVAEEITSSGTAQATTAVGSLGQVCAIINNGTDALWVAFGETAAVETGHFIMPNTVREFQFDGTNQAVSVINDS